MWDICQDICLLHLFHSSSHLLLLSTSWENKTLFDKKLVVSSMLKICQRSNDSFNKCTKFRTIGRYERKSGPFDMELTIQLFHGCKRVPSSDKGTSLLSWHSCMHNIILLLILKVGLILILTNLHKNIAFY